MSPELHYPQSSAPLRLPFKKRTPLSLNSILSLRFTCDIVITINIPLSCSISRVGYYFLKR